MASRDDWSNSHFLGLLLVAGVVVTIATVLPFLWVWRVLAVVGGAPLMFVVISLLSTPIRRLAVFLVGLAKPGPPITAGELRLAGEVDSTVIRAGANQNDPNSGRIVIERLDGSTHVEEVLPVGADLRGALAETVARLQIPVRSARAMSGHSEVDRWKPGIRDRLRLAWDKRAR